jgi:hypothetical protein
MNESKNPYERKDYPDHLDLDWLIENKLPVYVRNTTRPRGQIAINFVQVNGRSKVIKIPRTSLPIHLSRQVSGETIAVSDDLRQCIMKGVIELIRPDLAYAELLDPENAHEIQALQLSDFSSKNAFMSPRVSDMQKSIDGKVDANSPSLEPLGVETNVLNPRVMSMVEKLINGDMSIKAAMSELKILEPELKDTDCSYMITNGPEGQIRTYVQKILAKIRGTQVKASTIEDDAAPEMTPEEAAKEAAREAAARSHQRV